MSSWGVWDDQAATLTDARLAVWGTAPWDAGVAMCLDRITSVLDPAGSDGGRVLDLGCGIGRLLLPLADRWPSARLIGFDVSAEMLRHAAEASGDRANVRLCHGDWQQLHIVGRLDAAYSVLTFQHLRRYDQQNYLEALAGQLVPGAPLVLQFVPEGDEGPLNHPVPLATMAGWCDKADLTVTEVECPPERPTWLWLTAKRT